MIVAALLAVGIYVAGTGPAFDSVRERAERRREWPRAIMVRWPKRS